MRPRASVLAILLLALAPVGRAASTPGSEPFDAAEIRAMGEEGDVWLLPAIERAFEARWTRLAEFPPTLPPRELEEELVACLGAWSRLDPRAAARPARIVLSRLRRGPVAREARRALLAGGDAGAIRDALRSYFEDPVGVHYALAGAARATGDVRLRDFASGTSELPHGGTSLLSRIERNLARSRGRAAIGALIEAGASSRVLGALEGHELEPGLVRGLRARLARDEESEVTAALMALAERGALHASEVRAALDDERLRVRALAARLSGDSAALRLRLDGATEPFFSEAVAALIRLEGAEAARELAPLVQGRGLRANLAVFEALSTEKDTEAVSKLVTALAPSDRSRALRWLAERDHVALRRIPLRGGDVDRLHDHLARSRRAELRRSLGRARDERGRALAAGLLSGRADAAEKAELLEAMADAWAGALVAGGAPVWKVLSTLVDPVEVETWIETAPAEPELVAALALVPTPRARGRLQAIGSAEAVRRLLERDDRVLAVPSLTALRSHAEPGVREEATLALVRLGAAGATIYVRSELARGGRETALLRSVAAAKLDGGSLLAAIEPLASRPEPSPDAFAGLFLLHEIDPSRLLELAGGAPGPLSERARSVLSLSGEPKRIPLLVDMAMGRYSEASQESGLLALAEHELSFFGKRVHRLAGHPERRVRFLAAAALAPSAQPWAVRLLLAELDPGDPYERGRAALALARMSDESATSILLAMVEDGTAGVFGTGELLERCPEELLREASLQGAAWKILSPRVELGDPLALLAASRSSHPPALSAVVRRLQSPSR